MVAAFQEETWIETSYVRLSSGEAFARLQAGADNPEFSVWWGGPADAFVAANEEGLIEPYDSPNREAIADDLKGADGIWEKGGEKASIALIDRFDDKVVSVDVARDQGVLDGLGI